MVKLKCPNTLVNVDASSLTVFANRTTYSAKQPLDPRTRLSAIDGTKTFMVQVPTKEQSRPPRLRRWADLNEVLDDNKKAKSDSADQPSTESSYVSYHDVAKILRVPSYQQETKAIADEDICVLCAYMSRVGKVFGPIETGRQAKRLRVIAPILVCVSSLFGREAQIVVDEDIKGNRVLKSLSDVKYWRTPKTRRRCSASSRTTKSGSFTEI